MCVHDEDRCIAETIRGGSEHLGGVCLAKVLSSEPKESPKRMVSLEAYEVPGRIGLSTRGLLYKICLTGAHPTAPAVEHQFRPPRRCAHRSATPILQQCQCSDDNAAGAPVATSTKFVACSSWRNSWLWREAGQGSEQGGQQRAGAPRAAGRALLRSGFGPRPRRPRRRCLFGSWPRLPRLAAPGGGTSLRQHTRTLVLGSDPTRRPPLCFFVFPPRCRGFHVNGTVCGHT